jgi:hypothetical protein
MATTIRASYKAGPPRSSTHITDTPGVSAGQDMQCARTFNAVGKQARLGGDEADSVRPTPSWIVHPAKLHRSTSPFSLTPCR